MTDRELMQQALEALQAVKEAPSKDEIQRAWIVCNLLQKRLAQPEPIIDKSAAIRIATALGWEPRREWVGLTRDEVLDIEETAKHPLEFARSIETKLREKNT